MARTRRSTSYRKSKRWNPSRYSPRDENNIETVRVTRGGHRNPGSLTRYLGDASKVTVNANTGHVVVTDRNGTFSDYYVGKGRMAHFIRELLKGPAQRLNKYDFQGEILKDEGSYQISMNPKRSGRRNPIQHQKRYRGKLLSSGTYGRSTIVPASFSPRRSGYITDGLVGREFKTYSGAQSALRAKRSGRKSRRNPKIRRSEAKAMKRVLKRHGYNPRRGRKSSSRSRC